MLPTAITDAALSSNVSSDNQKTFFLVLHATVCGQVLCSSAQELTALWFLGTKPAVLLEVECHCQSSLLSFANTNQMLIWIVFKPCNISFRRKVDLDRLTGKRTIRMRRSRANPKKRSEKLRKRVKERVKRSTEMRSFCDLNNG